MYIHIYTCVSSEVSLKAFNLLERAQYIYTYMHALYPISGRGYSEQHVPVYLLRDNVHTCKCTLLYVYCFTCCLVFRAKNQEVLTLAEQVDLYTEAVRAKDHVVMELTNKVTSLCSIAACVDHTITMPLLIHALYLQLFQLENDGQLPAE